MFSKKNYYSFKWMQLKLEIGCWWVPPNYLRWDQFDRTSCFLFLQLWISDQTSLFGLMLCYLLAFNSLRQPKLPNSDGLIEDEDNDNEGTTVSSPEPTRRVKDAGLVLPPSAVSGLTGEELRKFEEYSDEVERVVPVSMCWTPHDELLVGCAGAQMLKVSHWIS